MSDGIEDAAIAFDRDMGSASPKPQGAGIRDSARAPEPIFGNSSVHEEDLAAGGDNEPDPKPRRTKQPEAEHEEEPENFFDPNFGDDGEEGDDEDEDVDDGVESGEEDEEELLGRKFTVMVDGEEEEITLKEALEGGIRTKTFYKRLNQIDGVKRDLAAHAEKIVEDRKRYDDMLAEAEEVMQAVLPQEPDWDKLFAEDPAKARALQKQYDEFNKKVAEVREKRSTAQREQAERDAKERVEYAKAEYPKFAAFAKWRNREEMQKDVSSMRKTALGIGFSEEEVAQVLDSRMLIVLLKASKFDRMMASRPKAVKTTKTPVNPGAGSKSTARRGIVGAQKKLARTGSVEDATDVFAKMIR